MKKGKKFYIADPGKGKTTYNLEEFRRHWISTRSNDEDKGIAMFFETTPAFFTYQMEGEDRQKEKRSFKFLFRYFKKYRKAFSWIVSGLLAGSALQLVLPFLTQSIVDVGIKNQDIGFIWLILLGQLMLTVSRTAIDFARRWFLLRISMRINISLVSDFFIKLLKLPMSFFDTKLMGDLMQRMSDHSRVNNFLTQQTLNITFAMLTFVVFSVVLFIYNKVVFVIFLLGSILYGGWMALFLRRRKVLDYELFEQQAINNNRTYEFITSMQEIKLQDCEQRKRKEWEETQVNLFRVQQKSLKLQQTQEAGSIFINEVKNIVVTVTAIGEACEQMLTPSSKAAPGMDIIVTGYVGLEGTAILANEKRAELETRFSKAFIDKSAAYIDHISTAREAASAIDAGVAAIHDASQGGIFGALWDMAEASGIGLDIDLKKLPVRQDTIEISEFFDINPYKLLSGGSLIIAATDGTRVVRELEKTGQNAVIVGAATDSNDRVLISGEERRFLETAQTDEIYKVFN